jgi:hypothetical protein
MKRIVLYESLDPYYNDFEETYIGTTLDEIDAQQYETEKFMGHNHPNGIDSIYKSKIVYEG